MEALRREIARRLGRRALFAEPMSRHTTWGVGGPAWCFCRVESAAELAWLIQMAAQAGAPLKIVGRGSNLLISDAGFAGLIVLLRGELARIQFGATAMVCGGGASLAKAVRRAGERGLAGLEWAVGIPATVGGALAGNAGAAGVEMMTLCRRMTLLSPSGDLRHMAATELAWGYRRTDLPAGAVILEAQLALRPEAASAVLARREQHLRRRKASQPMGARTAGSVFKNPAGDFAGRLIETAGLKGRRVGRAMISQVHANFIENIGGATAAQIAELMELAREGVWRAHGVRLEPEVERVGD